MGNRNDGAALSMQADHSPFPILYSRQQRQHAKPGGFRPQAALPSFRRKPESIFRSGLKKWIASFVAQSVMRARRL
jgi:hypothetical protein